MEQKKIDRISQLSRLSRERELTEEEKQELIERFRQMYDTRDFYVLYNRFLEEEGLPLLPDLPPEERKLAYEDVYPILYLKYRLQKRQGRQDIKHLVVDEMQDYSWIQYILLKKLFPCRMTILGDRAQTMEEHQQDVLGFLPKIFGKDIRRIIMNRSYRNTVEIAEYANQLAGIQDMELFERHGRPVEESSFPDRESALDQVLEIWKEASSRFETAALVFLTEKEARYAASYLKEKINADSATENTDKEAVSVSYLDRNSQTFHKGLTVTTFYLAKGLEFDQVFGLFRKEVEDRADSIQKQARYITATRALHELFMYSFQS